MTARHFNERWTEEEKQQLLGLVAKGLTYRQIGKAMGKTWNAIAGKCERMGLQRPERNTVKRKLVGVARGRQPKEKLPVACTEPPWGDAPALEIKPTRGKPEENRLTPAPHPSAVVARPSAAMWAPRTCQFPHGDVGTPGFHFCGAKIENPDGRSYCDPCHARCYMGRPKKAPGEGQVTDFQMHGWGGYR